MENSCFINQILYLYVPHNVYTMVAYAFISVWVRWADCQHREGNSGYILVALTSSGSPLEILFCQFAYLYATFLFKHDANKISLSPLVF